MNKRPKKYNSRSSGKRRSAKDNVWRIRLVVAFFTIAFTLLFARLFQVQVLNHSKYLSQSKSNVEKRRIVQARRGTIYDRNGIELARDVVQYSVAIRPGLLKDKSAVVRKVSKICNIPGKRIYKKISEKKPHIYIAHRVSVEDAEKLKKIKDPGLELEKKFLRVYPYKEIAAHVLGFCGDYNQPLGGIERQYDAYLQGKPGWKMYMRDALGAQIPDISVPGEDPLDGFSVKLTIDANYQSIIEDELKRAAEKYRVKDATVVLLDCSNGEVVGMASYPQFNPNSPLKSKARNRKNRAVSDAWEPGSTFKFAAFSAALENLNLNLDKDLVYCENGRYRLYTNTIFDHKAYKFLTWRDALVHSSNIGTMKLMQKINRKTFYRYVRNFGFGMISGVDLPGESPGILHPIEEFSRISPYFMSIGYEVSVTPLQLAVAYAAVANGGNLLKPFVMQYIQSHDGNIVERNEPTVIRRVINPETAEKLTDMMISVVERGTGKNAKLPNVKIAGKTGTAQLYDSKMKKHDHRKHLASFAGYFPANNPKYVLLVMMREPKGAFYGGAVAAPVFKEITRRIITLNPVLEESFFAENIEDTLVEAPTRVVPDMNGQDLGIAKNILKNHGYKVKVVGKGSVVASQKLELAENKPPEIVLTAKIKEKRVSNKIPKLKGLSIKESLELLSGLDLEANIEGHGVVVNQHPKAGTRIRENVKIKLVCRPL